MRVLVFQVSLGFTLLFNSNFVFAKKEARGTNKAQAATQKSKFPNPLKKIDFLSLTHKQKKQLVRNLQIIMVNYEKLQFRSGMKVSGLTPSFEMDALNYLLPKAFADDSDKCVIGGLLRTLQDNKCPTRGRPCSANGISDGFECGIIFGKACVQREPIADISERCFRESESRNMTVAEINNAYESAKDIIGRMVAVCNEDRATKNALGCEYLLKQLEKLKNNPAAPVDQVPDEKDECEDGTVLIESNDCEQGAECSNKICVSEDSLNVFEKEIKCSASSMNLLNRGLRCATPLPRCENNNLLCPGGCATSQTIDDCSKQFDFLKEANCEPKWGDDHKCDTDAGVQNCNIKVKNCILLDRKLSCPSNAGYRAVFTKQSYTLCIKDDAAAPQTAAPAADVAPRGTHK
jgi:hypothetical protein